MWVLARFKINLDFKSTHECNLDFKSTHECNLDFKSTLKSILISKTVLAHFEISFDFKGNFNCSQVNNFHIIFTMSHSWVLKRVWTLSSWMILLSRHQHRWKGVDCLGEDFQISMLYLLAKKSWCALNCSSVKIVWEVMSLISHAFKLTVHNFELSTWMDEDLTFNIPWAWYLPVNCELNFFFRIHKPQSTSMTIIVIHASEIDEWIESVSGTRVYCIHRAVFLTRSSEDFFPHISYLHSLTVIFIWDSTDNHLHLGDVRIKCLLFPFL